jgi:hypothetical protein
MAGIFKFDIKNLNSLISKNGLKKTWLAILVTHLSQKKHLQYVLKDQAFKGIKKLPFNLIHDLSIGEISILYEYSVALENHKSRKSKGQYFTPDDVADFMASFSKEFEKGIWLDPCSGIGNLSWHLVAMQKNPEEFLKTRIILSDTDQLALLIARSLFTFSFQNKNHRLFEDIENRFITFDFLSVSDNSKDVLFKLGDELEKVPKHDFVIVNPPYLSTRSNDRFETAKSGDLYAYFLENIIKTSRGFISITPQSFTNAHKFKVLRKLLLENFPSLKIFLFDNVPANIFKGIKFGSTNSNQSNSVRAAIIVAQNKPGKQQITSLLRWRSSERKILFENIERFLSDVPLSDEFFPKVSKEYKDLYMELSNMKTLNSICSPKRTKFPLYVPSAPRYFIPALKKPAKRASQKVIYFPNEQDRDFAYMAINSSLLYWWWRVRDGGMTLSLETLMSLPLPDFKVNKNIVSELEKSERTSKVYKQNAGSAQENVKHPKALIIKLNHAVIPKYAKILTSLHENSELTRLIKQK